uniref:Nuclease SbcCD subunit C n=1 Tax=Cyanothece sp. (strain PCC 7425 / ATCC 29141) TaxID=395961 RepID=B8HRJ5_CYAP4
MIPLRLTLKNFLSYREATLDFSGLHVACICGANGAGKSSLLEAIAWAIWGESRAGSEDDLIHLGTKEAQVDFIFTLRQQTYRIIRSRHRGQSNLEFQVAIPEGFRSLTERGLRATQDLICQHLRLDYETFVNSAYLRQGRADEFMLKRPTERKQLLAELLKLDQYDLLSERAKDWARQLKGQTILLENSLAEIEQQLQQRQTIDRQQQHLETELHQLRQQQESRQQQLQTLQTSQQQIVLWQQQLTWHRQQQQNLHTEVERLQQQYTTACQQANTLFNLLQQQEQILAGYTRWHQLQEQEESLSAKFQLYQATQAQRQQLQHQQAEQLRALKHQHQQLETQKTLIEQHQQELQQTLSRSDQVTTALEELQRARVQLHRLDQLQTQAFPLLQRQRELQLHLDRAHSRLSARLDELRASTAQLQTQQARQPQLQQAVLETTEQLTYLEKRRIYQQHVREKGLERRHFMERLQAQQREYEVQLAQLEQKMQLLTQPDAHCPLCDSPLDQHHWSLVRQRHEQQQQEIFDQIWVVREQLAVSEREIQVLRQEYRQLEQELSQWNTVLERRGHLQAQLQTTDSLAQRLEQVTAEVTGLERSLQNRDFATELETDLQQIQTALEELNYDEKNHAIARGQVEYWRWAEVKQAELQQARKRQAQLAQQLPALEEQITILQTQIEQQQNSELQRQIEHLEQTLASLDYNLEYHHELRQTLRQQQIWTLRHQELLRAQQNYPQVQQSVQTLHQSLQLRQQELGAIGEQMTNLTRQLAQTHDHSQRIRELETQLQADQQQREQKLSELGRLQQLSHQLTLLEQQSQQQRQQLARAGQQLRIYQELAQAFGKNGIQALMIENILPQLEVETNQLLARLSGSQLHVQFFTQKAGRSNKPSGKLIDTLDILISDLRGTRPYETYSGGEAFRVNFAIRLALARLLAQCSGNDLQMLIIDEGFGTQDAEGCERLIAAINAIAPDFACILTVTHMPSLREAFQTRIEVQKTEEGSQLNLLV